MRFVSLSGFWSCSFFLSSFQPCLFVTFDFVSCRTDVCVCVCVLVIVMDGEGNTCQKQPHRHRVTIVPTHMMSPVALSVRFPLSQFVSASVCLSLSAFWVIGSPSRHARAPFSVHSASILATKLSESAD